jgi:cytochrome c oxidase subunit 2
MASRSARRVVLATLIAVTAVLTACSSDDGGGTKAEGAAGQGQALFSSKGCAGCHSTDGSRRTGPSLQGVVGSKVELSDGSTVTADKDYIAESIRQPQAKTVKGFSARMPKFDLSNEEIDQIIAYLETL